MDCSDRGGMHCKVLLSYFRWKSDQHFLVRNCDEAGDFKNVTLAWNDSQVHCPCWKAKVADSILLKKHIFWKMKNKHHESTRGQTANPEEAVWWGQAGWKVSLFKQKPGCDTPWWETFQNPGLCNQMVETDALQLYWELRSGCGLICGDSLGKQSQNLAFYWKLNKASCQ